MDHPYRPLPAPLRVRRDTRFRPVLAALYQSFPVLMLFALLVAPLMFAVTACPPAAPRAPWGVVRVGLEGSTDGLWGWSSGQHAELHAYINNRLDVLGYDFQVVPPAQADVLVRAANFEDGAVGKYTPGRTYIEIDARAAQGYEALRRAVGHELVHWLTWEHWQWVGHLCEWPINVPPPATCHAEIRCVNCLSARGLVFPPDLGPETTEAYAPEAAWPDPTEEDVALVARCHYNNRCE